MVSQPHQAKLRRVISKNRNTVHHMGIQSAETTLVNKMVSHITHVNGHKHTT